MRPPTNSASGHEQGREPLAEAVPRARRPLVDGDRRGQGVGAGGALRRRCRPGSAPLRPTGRRRAAARRRRASRCRRPPGPRRRRASRCPRPGSTLRSASVSAPSAACCAPEGEGRSRRRTAGRAESASVPSRLSDWAPAAVVRGAGVERVQLVGHGRDLRRRRQVRPPARRGVRPRRCPRPRPCREVGGDLVEPGGHGGQLPARPSTCWVAVCTPSATGLRAGREGAARGGGRRGRRSTAARAPVASRAAPSATCPVPSSSAAAPSASCAAPSRAWRHRRPPAGRRRSAGPTRRAARSPRRRPAACRRARNRARPAPGPPPARRRSRRPRHARGSMADRPSVVPMNELASL